MGIPLPKTPFTAADYLAWEAEQTERHDFVNGEVFSMAGAEDRHVTAAGNAYIALRQHFTGTPCHVYMSDMKLHVVARGNYFYPDLFVTCSDTDRQSKLSKSEPTLIIEVLSASTAAYDRGEKFANYRAIPTLKEYVLIDLDKRTVDVHRLGEQGLWVLHPFELAAADSAFSLASADLTITSAQLFADV